MWASRAASDNVTEFSGVFSLTLPLMITPESYGLTEVQTLAHVAGPAVAHGDHQFWHALRKKLDAAQPALERLGSVAAFGDPGVTHVFASPDGVRIGVGLLVPEGDVHGCVVTLHGYHAPPIGDVNPFERHGLALMQVRVRGYPGSLADCAELAHCETGWITLGIEKVEQWSVTGALMDVASAVVAARRAVGGRPVYLRGESFGGGLGVLACALLDADAPDRLAIGLPSLGDWRWRMEHVCHGGAGEQVADYLRLNPFVQEDVRQSLALMDSAIHARFVRTPTLCKLACCDEVVPAPTAAAVFNALGTDPARKRRFLTAFGHFDAGIADARRHAAFERAVVEFFNPHLDVDSALEQATEVVEVRLSRARARAGAN